VGPGPGPGAAAARVAHLSRQLGADRFADREAASKELTAIGEPALGALRQAAARGGDAEVRRRAERIVRAAVRRAARAEMRRLEGSWVAVSEEDNGRSRPCRTRVVLGGGRSVAVSEAGAGAFRCTWEALDATVRPKQVDLVTPGGQVFRAIYELEGDTLRYCGSYAGRPSSFSTRAGDGRYMATLKRAAK
jgi:uncharacterized protein (TIGR03067 family)